MMSAIAAALLAAAAATGAPTLAELGQATYSGLKEARRPVALKEGRWERGRLAVTLAPGFRVTGDLDGDGAQEAVVVLAVSTGGSGTFDYLAVAKRTARGVRNVAVAPLGDRVRIRSARVEGRELRLSVLRAGPRDALCCPGELADVAWTWTAGGLRAGASKVTGRLTPAVAAGPEWVLRAWKADVPAPAEPQVTLRFDDGRFAGRSGCNRYSTVVAAGNSPGAVKVAPVVLTRMACADAQMEVEARFVKQLEAVVSVGFQLGQLALGYQLAGGVPETMLFEPRPAAGK